MATAVAWAASLPGREPGWIVVPTGLMLALFLGLRLPGRVAYRVTIAVLSFVGFTAVGTYVTAVAVLCLGLFGPREEWSVAMGLLVAMAFFPGAVVVGLLLARGVVVAVNSRW